MDTTSLYSRLPTRFVTRLRGEYGHFVAPLTQSLEDLGNFLGISLSPFCDEIEFISRESQGIHPEEAALLFALVRGLRPNLILETGTFKGYSTTQIARAIRINNTGHLITIDIDQTSGSLVPSDLTKFITFKRGIPSSEVAILLNEQGVKIEMFFHDSLHTFINTLGELIWFSHLYQPNCVIVCHDAKMDFKQNFGVGRAIREFAERLNLEYLILDTTCGLAVIRWKDSVTLDPFKLLAADHTRYQKRLEMNQLQKLISRFLRL